MNNVRKLRNNSPETERNRKNMFDISYKILKRNTFLKTKSVGKRSFSNNNSEKNIDNKSEMQLIKEAWKIITKKKIFNEELLGSSKRVLFFFLSLCGIYKGSADDFIIKKEFRFLLNEPSDIINEQLSHQIYKKFFSFRNSIINNSIDKIRPKKKESEIRYIELNRNYKVISKSFINKRNFNTNIKNDKENFVKRKNKKKFFNIPKNLNLNNDKDVEINNTKEESKEKKRRNKNYKRKIKRNNNDDNNKNKNNSVRERCQNIIVNEQRKKNIKNEDNVVRNLQINKNSNSSVNSNSLFSQSFYEPDKNKENNKDNNINKNGDHLNEKNSSISHYIFNEDYRIKDDIESYSNLNDYEMNKEKKYK